MGDGGVASEYELSAIACQLVSLQPEKTAERRASFTW